MTISSAAVQYLAQAARAAPSADNSQPVQVLWNGEYFSLTFSTERGKGRLFGPGANATLLAAGATMENIDQAGTALGIAMDWRFPRLPETGAPYVEAHCHHNDNQEAVQSLPLFARHTNRLPYRKTPLPIDALEHASAARENNARVLVLVEPQGRRFLIEAARRAAEVRFCTPELHDWLVSSLRFSADAVQRGDGLDLATLHLPPGGRAFLRFIADWKRMAMLNRIGAYKALAVTETVLLKQAPALVCVVGKDDPRSTLDAGRLLARIWTAFNNRGIAVHPYYVITDQLFRLRAGTVPSGMISSVEVLSRELPLNLGMETDETLHMLLRIGFPTANPTRSQRLPLATVFTDCTKARPD